MPGPAPGSHHHGRSERQVSALAFGSRRRPSSGFRRRGARHTGLWLVAALRQRQASLADRLLAPSTKRIGSDANNATCVRPKHTSALYPDNGTLPRNNHLPPHSKEHHNENQSSRHYSAGRDRKMISAYLDPASGSVIITALAAGGAGIAIAGRAVLCKLRFGKNKSSNETPIYDETDDSERVGEPDETTQ